MPDKEQAAKLTVTTDIARGLIRIDARSADGTARSMVLLKPEVALTAADEITIAAHQMRPLPAKEII